MQGRLIVTRHACDSGDHTFAVIRGRHRDREVVRRGTRQTHREVGRAQILIGVS